MAPVWAAGFSGLAGLGQHALRLSRLPLGVIQAFPGLSEIEITQARLRILDGPDGEVQPLAGFSELLKLRVFGCDGSKPDRAH